VPHPASNEPEDTVGDAKSQAERIAPWRACTLMPPGRLASV